MANYPAESFYRGTIRQSITNTTSVPFSLKVSKIPTLTAGLLTLSPNTADEEIIEYNGIDATSLTITVVKRGINPSTQVLTTSGTDYNNPSFMKSHSQNNTIRGDVNHLHIIQDYADKLNKSGGTLTGLVQGAKSTDIASATTTDLSTLTGNYAHITGTTTITSFGTAVAGTQVTLVFDGILTITHNATSLILPSGANIVSSVGDSAIFESEGSGNWKCVSYTRANGSPLVAPSVVRIGGSGVDGSPSVGNLTITGSNDSVIIKNYVNFAIGSNTLTITPTGCLVIIKVQGTLNLTGTTINFTGKGSLGGAGGVGTTNTVVPGASGGLSLPVKIIGTAATGGGGGQGASLYSGGGGGGGGSSIALSGTAGGNATSGGVGGVAGINPERFTSLDFMKGTLDLPTYIGQGGGGGGAGGGNFSNGVPGADGGAGGAGGGSLIFLVEGDIILSSTTVNVNGNNGTNGATKSPTAIPTGGGGGGGGGSGGIFVALCLGTLSGSVTPNVAGGTGGTGGALSGSGTAGAAGGNGGNGLYLISNI